MVVAKFGSLPSAAASSFRVSNAPGADATSAATASRTNRVLAAWSFAVPTATLGTRTLPVNSGLAKSALFAKAALTCVAV
ncbi:hypothetical protein D3C81_1657690 [compost metagenome]